MIRRLSFGILVMAGLTVAAFAQTPTFSENIAPILFKNCVSCHRDGEIGGFALENYAQVVEKKSTLKSVVQGGLMPPWRAVQGYGEFLNEHRLTDEEKKMIGDWVDGGVPEGDKSKLPPLPQFPQGSQLGTPDLVLKIPTVWKVKGDMQDVYRNFVIPTGLLEDKNVAAIEVRPGNKKVVHHVLLWNDITGTGRTLDEQDSEAGYEDYSGPGFNDIAVTYVGWAPGSVPRFYPAGIGTKMYKNSDLIVQIHYAPSPTDEEDQTTFNIFFKKESNIREVFEYPILPDNMPGGYNAFTIPANQSKKFLGSYRVTQDVSLSAVFPHMHLLGRNCRLFAVTPAKDTIKLIKIDDWAFDWQGSYLFKNLQKIPRNSVVYYEATYDNTTNNLYNPNNPPKRIDWGFKTTEEMYLCYLLYLPYKSGDENLSQETITSIENQDTPQPAVVDVQGISPNPVQGMAQLQFTLFAEKYITADLIDMNGRSLLNLESGKRYIAGKNAIAVATDGLANGVYVCRLNIDGKSIAIPFSVVK